MSTIPPLVNYDTLPTSTIGSLLPSLDLSVASLTCFSLPLLAQKIDPECKLLVQINKEEYNGSLTHKHLADIPCPASTRIIQLLTTGRGIAQQVTYGSLCAPFGILSVWRVLPDIEQSQSEWQEAQDWIESLAKSVGPRFQSRI
jgi:hypothetical protein